MMAVGHAGLEPGRVARTQDRRSVILDQRDLAFDDVDELVLGLMPMSQRRCGSRLEPGEIDAELSEPGDVAERCLLAAVGHTAPRLGIHTLGTYRRFRDVDLGHRPLLAL